MQFSSIASGSSGNCLYVGNDDTHILIDAGISKKRIVEGLLSMGVDPESLDAIFVTHEHADHIQGIGVMSRKYHIPVFSTKGTIMEMLRNKNLGKVDSSLFHVVRPGEDLKIKNMTISPFSMPHDAADPVSYSVRDDHRKIGMVTDLGFYDQHILDALSGSDLLYVEANHDLRMLETGPYPYDLKRRVAGNYGHLCNEMAGRMVGQSLNPKLQQVILGHLSKENNYPALALESVKAELKMQFGVGERDLPVSVAPRDTIFGLVDLG